MRGVVASGARGAGRRARPVPAYWSAASPSRLELLLCKVLSEFELLNPPIWPPRAQKSIATGPAKFDSRARPASDPRVSIDRRRAKRDQKCANASVCYLVRSASAWGLGIGTGRHCAPGNGRVSGKLGRKTPIKRLLTRRRYSYSNIRF